MRFMIMVKANKDSEAGVMPEEELMARMATYHEELVKAGALLDGSGLKPSSEGWRIRYSGGKRTIVDGPFTEAKELIAGYTLIQVKSPGGSARVEQALPRSPWRRRGKRDRSAPPVRARRFRPKRGRRTISRIGDGREEVAPVRLARTGELDDDREIWGLRPIPIA